MIIFLIDKVHFSIAELKTIIALILIFSLCIYIVREHVHFAQVLFNMLLCLKEINLGLKKQTHYVKR